MAFWFGCAVVDEVSILGISISQKVEGLVLQTHEHSRTKYYISPNTPHQIYPIILTQTTHTSQCLLSPAKSLALLDDGLNNMIQCIDQIQISISERFDHLTTLLVDGQQLTTIMKDDERKRVLVRNFRIIKSSEKARVATQQRCLKQLERCRQLSRGEVIACESMIANCMNQYLNTDYEARKSGELSDLVDIFLFYYKQIRAQAKVSQLTVLRNCNLVGDVPFLQENLAFLLSNCVYEREKEKFLNMTKYEPRSISPEKKEEEQEERFDVTGRRATRQKKRLQQYCFQLKSIYVNYFYFNSLDTEKRKRALASNYAKRNLHIRRVIDSFAAEFRTFREREKKR